MKSTKNIKKRQDSVIIMTRDFSCKNGIRRRSFYLIWVRLVNWEKTPTRLKILVKNTVRRKRHILWWDFESRILFSVIKSIQLPNWNESNLYTLMTLKRSTQIGGSPICSEEMNRRRKVLPFVLSIVLVTITESMVIG